MRHASLQGATLFDCGPGTIRSLALHGVTLADLQRVVLTHFHVDHCLDLAALAFARRNPASQCGPLRIYGPAGLARVLAGLESAFGRGATFERTTMRVLDAHDGFAGVELDSARLRWVANGHTADSISIVVQTSDGSRVAYTGDTGPCPEFEELAGDADLLVCECSFPEQIQVPKHLTPQSAAQLATRARARRLLLTHFYPMLDAREAGLAAARDFDGPIETARDGSRHRF